MPENPIFTPIAAVLSELVRRYLFIFIDVHSC